MKETVDVDGCIARGDFGPVNAWNRAHIWRYGSLLTAQEVLDTALGEPFNPDCYLDYLEDKCRDVYGI